MLAFRFFCFLSDSFPWQNHEWSSWFGGLASVVCKLHNSGAHVCRAGWGFGLEREVWERGLHLPGGGSVAMEGACSRLAGR